jgi:hypothetical protein
MNVINVINVMNVINVINVMNVINVINVIDVIEKENDVGEMRIDKRERFPLLLMPISHVT